MSHALAALEASLARAMLGPAPNALSWSDPKPMARAAAEVRETHGGAAIEAKPETILAAVKRFKRTGRADNFRDLKYVCLGLGGIDGDGWCALADEELRSKVVRAAEGQAAPHRRLRCFQAMLSSYWSFPLYDASVGEEANDGWRGLRAWLRAERDRLESLVESRPPWFETLLRHPQLLTTNACEDFGSELLRGESASFEDARRALAIPDESWVVERAVIEQMRAGCEVSDGPFKSALGRLLPVATGKLTARLGETIKKRCVGILVSRYSRCADCPEHPALRDAAVGVVGNPWLHRVQWDAWVRRGDAPDELARGMVFGWLKGRLVADFFELLSVDGVNDRRRVAYWLRFVPFIDDMWFVLGTSAWYRSGAAFSDFKERAKGRLLSFEGAAPDNNAFVMRVGDYLAVEFGAKGNAFYLYRWSELPPSLLRSLSSERGRASAHMAELKSSTNDFRMSHTDAPKAARSWEQKFDDRILPLIGKRPDERPALVPEIEAALTPGVRVEDKRPSGGMLWIYESDGRSTLSRKLETLGFRPRTGIGWYRE